MFNTEESFSFSQTASFLGYEDFPCKVTQFYYHPGLQAVMYMMDDGNTLIIKADRAIGTGDPCEQKLLGTAG